MQADKLCNMSIKACVTKKMSDLINWQISKNVYPADKTLYKRNIAFDGFQCELMDFRFHAKM